MLVATGSKYHLTQAFRSVDPVATAPGSVCVDPRGAAYLCCAGACLGVCLAEELSNLIQQLGVEAILLCKLKRVQAE